MSIPHFFVEQALTAKVGERNSLAVSPETMAHLHTLRLRAGEQIVLVDRPGHGWIFCLDSSPNKKTGAIDGVFVGEKNAAQQIQLTLVQGISTADRMDQTIRQVSELGVSHIVPLKSQRSTVRLDTLSTEKKQARWQRIACTAAEQSCQLFAPTIEYPSSLEEALAWLKAHDLLLFFWEEATMCSLNEALASVAAHSVVSTLTGSVCSATASATGSELNKGPLKVAVFIGPEGGFSLEEALLIEAQGAKTLSLGSTILRTETAAVVACALVLHGLEARDGDPLALGVCGDSDLGTRGDSGLGVRSGN